MGDYLYSSINQITKEMRKEDEAIKGILDRITLKKIKTGVGHDLAGYVCEVFLDGKKNCFANDDGRGGEVDIDFYSKDLEANMDIALAENNVAKALFENGWDFMKSADAICFHTQLVAVIEAKLNIVEEEKETKKFINKRNKLALKGIVFGDDKSFANIQFKITLKEIVQQHGDKGIAIIQKHYDRIKNGLKKDERILNENLQELGIKL